MRSRFGAHVLPAVLAVLLGLSLLLAGCGSSPGGTPAAPTPFPTAAAGAGAPAFTLTSPAFAASQAIPRDFSCDGAGGSPALAWSAPPPGTASLALIMEDPDTAAGTFTHWVLYDLPAGTRSLRATVPPGASGPAGSFQGPNSSGRAGYSPPCPPSGTHRYFFHLYALDAAPAVSSTADEAALLLVLPGHVLAQADLLGTYGR